MIFGEVCGLSVEAYGGRMNFGLGFTVAVCVFGLSFAGDGGA